MRIMKFDFNWKIEIKDSLMKLDNLKVKVDAGHPSMLGYSNGAKPEKNRKIWVD